MGFFSDPCWSCGAVVKKSLRFCPECGAPGRHADFACPRCNGTSRGGQRNCTHCGAVLVDGKGKFVERALLVDKTWSREPDDFAARLHVQDVKGLFAKWVVLEEGTAALAFQDGKYAGALGPGRHDHTALGQRMMAAFNLATPAVFVLVDIGDVELETLCECLTSESLPVAVSAKVVVGLKDPLRFFQNLMKGRSVVRKGDLERSLEKEVETVIQAEIRHTALREMTGNIKLRDNVLGLLNRNLAMTLARYGLDLVHVSSLAFESEDLKRLTGGARQVFELRAAEPAAEAAHESSLKQEIRKQELERARQQDDLRRRGAEGEFARDQARRDQQQQLDLLKQKRENDVEAWKKQQEADLAMKQAKLAMYSNAAPAALATILEGAEFERLMKVEDLRAQEKMSPEQMLVFVAGKSPDVARALAAKYVADGTLQRAQAEKLFAEQKAAMALDLSEHAMDRVADVAEGRAKAAANVVCPGCGRGVMGAFNFCPYCQAKLKA